MLALSGELDYFWVEVSAQHEECRQAEDHPPNTANAKALRQILSNWSKLRTASNKAATPGTIAKAATTPSRRISAFLRGDVHGYLITSFVRTVA